MLKQNVLNKLGSQGGGNKMSNNYQTQSLRLDDMYKRCTIKALNKAPTLNVAARMLGVSRRTVHRWVREFNIEFCDRTKSFIIKNNSNASTQKPATKA